MRAIACNDAALRTRDSVGRYAHRCGGRVRRHAMDDAIVEEREMPILLPLASQVAARSSGGLRRQSEGRLW